jgi:xanthine dehydrogenase YagT iron-sulfur-binding subunit
MAASERAKELQRGGAADDGMTRRQLMGNAAAAGAGLAATSLLRGRTAHAADASAAPTTAPSASAMIPGAVPVTLKINGKQYELHLEPRVTLLDALREYIGLTGSKKGCDHGQCGACTVLVDGRRFNSCLTLAIAHQGSEITTIEGLAHGDQLHPMQSAFVEHDGMQCGYCTSGQICSAIGLLNEKHAVSDDDIREQMAGNICRCGAYPNIVTAVRQVLDVQVGASSAHSS